MNEKKMSIYYEIHRLHRLGFNKSQIERKVGVNRDTVRKYLAKDFKEMSEWTNTLQNRKKKLDPYETVILEWVKEHSDLSAAQIEDWLLEEYPDIQVSSSTVRSYVKNLRDQYAIPKRKKVRQYEAVPEVEMGAQIQVDWGQTKQETRSKEEVKLYFISFVLSHSRYKYLEWLDRPFTTKDTIRSHENAFRHFGGMPQEMVYDQDNLIAVSENAGDLLLTQVIITRLQVRLFRALSLSISIWSPLIRTWSPVKRAMLYSAWPILKKNYWF